MIVNNNDKNYANNFFNMIFIQVKKTRHGSYISNKKLHLFWNKWKEEPHYKSEQSKCFESIIKVIVEFKISWFCKSLYLESPKRITFAKELSESFGMSLSIYTFETVIKGYTNCIKMVAV